MDTPTFAKRGCMGLPFNFFSVPVEEKSHSPQTFTTLMIQVTFAYVILLKYIWILIRLLTIRLKYISLDDYLAMMTSTTRKEKVRTM